MAPPFISVRPIDMGSPNMRISTAMRLGYAEACNSKKRFCLTLSDLQAMPTRRRHTFRDLSYGICTALVPRKADPSTCFFCIRIEKIGNGFPIFSGTARIFGLKVE